MQFTEQRTNSLFSLLNWILSILLAVYLYVYLKKVFNKAIKRTVKHHMCYSFTQPFELSTFQMTFHCENLSIPLALNPNLKYNDLRDYNEYVVNTE